MAKNNKGARKRLFDESSGHEDVPVENGKEGKE